MLLNNKIPLQLNIPIRQTIQQLHKALLKGTSKNLLRAPIVGAGVMLEISRATLQVRSGFCAPSALPAACFMCAARLEKMTPASDSPSKALPIVLGES